MNLLQTIVSKFDDLVPEHVGLGIIEAVRTKALDRTRDLHWAAYCGAAGQLEAAKEREQVAHQHRARAEEERMAAEARAEQASNELRNLRAEHEIVRSKLELLIEQAPGHTIEAWRLACVEVGISVSEL